MAYVIETPCVDGGETLGRYGPTRPQRESVPASKSVEAVTGQDVVLGDQLDMAFMNTPVTHGSGLMVVTGTGADTAVGRILGGEKIVGEA